MCAIADVNEIVVTQKIWSQIESIIFGWDINHYNNQNIKGFSKNIETFHIKPPTLRLGNNLICENCGFPLTLVKTEDGFLDFQCPEEKTRSRIA